MPNPPQIPHSQKANDFIVFGQKISRELFESLPLAEQQILLDEIQYWAQEKEKSGLPFFVPNGAQEEFITGIGNAPVTGKRIHINTAANAVGKTVALCNILGNVIYGVQTQWFNHPLFTKPWMFPRKIWYVSEGDAFQNKIIDELKLWFPKGTYSTSKAGRKFDSHFEFDNGWTLTAKTFDQDERQFESADIGIICIDEPPSKGIFNACVTRTRNGGIIIMGMTPLVHSAWIFDDLIDNEEKKKDVAVYYADVEQACIEHGVRGHLRHEQIEFLASNYDEDEKQARVHGKPKHLAGKIYKTLHPAIHKHTIPAHEFNQIDNMIYCVMDVHDRRPPLTAWFAVNSDGKTYCIDEYPNDPKVPYHTIKSTSLTYKDYCGIIKQRELENGWNSDMILRVLDPNYGRRQVQAVGMTIQEILANEGLYFSVDVNDNLTEGHARVRDILASDMDGFPNFRIGEQCFNIWFQMNRYGIKEHSAKKAEQDGLSEKVSQKYKDGADVVRYFAMMFQPFTNDQKKLADKQRKEITPETDIVMMPGDFQYDWRNVSSTLLRKK